VRVSFDAGAYGTVDTGAESVLDAMRGRESVADGLTCRELDEPTQLTHVLVVSNAAPDRRLSLDMRVLMEDPGIDDGVSERAKEEHGYIWNRDRRTQRVRQFIDSPASHHTGPRFSSTYASPANQGRSSGTSTSGFPN
jgi:hypothetical protein